MVLRQEVFAVEQGSAYVDADGKDQASYHVLGEDEKNQLVAYARICSPGVAYSDYVSIGRVVVDQAMRSSGEGYRLMETSLQYCSELFPGIPNKISAQKYLQKFYGNLGYYAVGEVYLEDDIPHIAMIRS